MGPFAATWLLASPTTEMLTIRNDELQCAVRRRLGIAVLFEGQDPHGHAKLADGTGGARTPDILSSRMLGDKSSGRRVVSFPTVMWNER